MRRAERATRRCPTRASGAAARLQILLCALDDLGVRLLVETTPGVFASTRFLRHDGSLVFGLGGASGGLRGFLRSRGWSRGGGGRLFRLCADKRRKNRQNNE